jgi:hypothetical protein
VTSELGVFALGDLDHQQNSGESRRVLRAYSYGKLAQVKIRIAHAVKRTKEKPVKAATALSLASRALCNFVF